MLTAGILTETLTTWILTCRILTGRTFTDRRFYLKGVSSRYSGMNVLMACIKHWPLVPFFYLYLLRRIRFLDYEVPDFQVRLALESVVGNT